MNFINIGFGNFVSVEKIVGVVSPDAAPIKRLVSDAKDKGMLIDASCGRKTQTVIIFDSNHIVLSALNLKQINSRINGEEEEK